MLPALFGHGTSVADGVQILSDVAMKGSTGIAGFGVYAFACPRAHAVETGEVPTLEEEDFL